MKKSERNKILKWADSLSNEELEIEYYDSVLDSLGSLSEEMYDLGYDIRDIQEREKHEIFLLQRSNLLCELCKKRGIELWKE